MALPDFSRDLAIAIEDLLELVGNLKLAVFEEVITCHSICIHPLFDDSMGKTVKHYLLLNTA